MTISVKQCPELPDVTALQFLENVYIHYATLNFEDIVENFLPYLYRLSVNEGLCFITQKDFWIALFHQTLISYRKGDKKFPINDTLRTFLIK